jgi:hypothetical protein
LRIEQLNDQDAHAALAYMRGIRRFLSALVDLRQ